MKFTCEKQRIMNAVNTTSHAVAAKSPMNALEGFLLETCGDKIKMSGYDLKTGITSSFYADITETGETVVNAKLFGDIIRKMDDDYVTVTVDEKLKVTITGDNSRFVIMASPAEDYPDMPTIEDSFSIYMQQQALKSMIAQTNFAVSTSEARPIQTGALFETDEGILTVVAVDGYRLALRREEIFPKSNNGLSFVVPGAALSEVEKILSDTEDEVEINIGDKHVMFIIGDDMLISRRLEGDFLNYKKSIPMNGKIDVKADRRLLLNVVDRVSLIINDKIKSPLRCIFDSNSININTVTPIGDASDTCMVEGEGGGFEIGFNNRYLMDALKAAPADSIILRLNTPVTPCLILPEDGSDKFLYMVLPVRLKANVG